MSECARVCVYVYFSRLIRSARLFLLHRGCRCCHAMVAPLFCQCGGSSRSSLSCTTMFSPPLIFPHVFPIHSLSLIFMFVFLFHSLVQFGSTHLYCNFLLKTGWDPGGWSRRYQRQRQRQPVLRQPPKHSGSFLHSTCFRFPPWVPGPKRWTVHPGRPTHPARQSWVWRLRFPSLSGSRSRH